MVSVLSGYYRYYYNPYGIVMPYKDPNRQRQANREAQRRYRQRHLSVPKMGLPLRVSEARIILGVEGRLTKTKIKQAYMRMSITIHPDKNSGEDVKRLSALANDANKTLMYWYKHHPRFRDIE